ncbi:recombinase family protein [Luteibacter sp. PPL554]
MARELNRRGVLNDAGRRWSCATVPSLLDNEKHAGHLLYHRRSKKLAGRLVHNPKSECVRVDHAHVALVPPELFAAVHRKRAERMTHVSNGEMLERVRQLLRREGYLSRELLDVDAEPGILSARVLHQRFGSLTALYKKVGYASRQKPYYVNVRGWLTGWRASLTGFLAGELDDAGSRVERHGWVLHIDRAWTVSFTVMHRQLEHGHPRWKNYRTNAGSDFVVFARWASGEDVPRYYFILPRMLFPDMPRVFAPTNSVLLESFRFPSLAVLKDLARLSRIEEPGAGASVAKEDGKRVAEDEKPLRVPRGLLRSFLQWSGGQCRCLGTTLWPPTGWPTTASCGWGCSGRLPRRQTGGGRVCPCSKGWCWKGCLRRCSRTRSSAGGLRPGIRRRGPCCKGSCERPCAQPLVTRRKAVLPDLHA